jgi:hypothetical protein
VQRDPIDIHGAPDDAGDRAAYRTPVLRRFGHLADVTRATDKLGAIDGMMGTSRNRT